jgi:hypothetical protein
MASAQRAWRRHPAVLGLFAVAALVMTYPRVLHMADHVPRLGDPFVELWVLSSFSRKLPALDFAHFFEGTAFWPSPFALTMNEHLLGWQPLVLPLFLATGNMVAAYNAAMLISVVLAGYFMYLLARRVTGSAAAGVFAGLAFTFAPYRVEHWDHFHLWGYFWMPLTLFCLHRLIGSGVGDQHLKSCRPRAPNPGPQVLWGLAAGLGAAMQFQTSMHLGAFLAPALVLFVLLFVPTAGAWRRGSVWIGLAVGALVAAAGTAWTVIPYAEAHRVLGFRHTQDEFLLYSPAMSDYLRVPTGLPVLAALGAPVRDWEVASWLGAVVMVHALLGFFAGGRLRTRAGARGRYAATWIVVAALASAGFVLLVGGWELLAGLGLAVEVVYRPFVLGGLALAAVATAVVAPRDVWRGLARWWSRPATLYAAAALVLWLVSLGPMIRVTPNRPLGPGPFRYLTTYVPGYANLRAPCRMSIVVSLTVSVLGAMGVAGVERRIKGARARRAYAAAACLLVAAEFWMAPLRSQAVPWSADVRDLCAWLARQEDDPVIVHFPFPGRGVPEWQQKYFMYLSGFHGRRLMNDLAFTPFRASVHGYVRPILADFPGAAAIDALQALEVRYAVLHWDLARETPGSLGTPTDPRLIARTKFGLIQVLEVAPRRSSLPSVLTAPAEERELVALLRLLEVATGEEALQRCEEGLAAVSRRMADKDRCTALVGAAYDQVGAPGRCVLVAVLRGLRTASADRLLRRALDDPDPTVREWARAALGT